MDVKITQDFTIPESFGTPQKILFCMGGISSLGALTIRLTKKMPGVEGFAALAAMKMVVDEISALGEQIRDAGGLPPREDDKADVMAESLKEEGV